MRLISLEKMIRTQQYVYACRKQLSANDTTVVVSRSTLVADAVKARMFGKAIDVIQNPRT
jgi:hypothetical protein